LRPSGREMFMVLMSEILGGLAKFAKGN
jgi:hypothetical protein